MLDFFLPGADDVTPTITLFIAMVGVLVLAGLDIWREEVEDLATIALLGIVVITLAAEGITLEQWTVGIACAALAFTFYLELGIRGVMGGGDVKLAVVPALVLGASVPFLGLWWISVALVVQKLMGAAVVKAAGIPAKAIALPHVPAMATATFVSMAIALPVL